jgi:hypothetical protein
MTRYRWRGTHGGEFRGIAPTGEQEINGIGIFRFSPEGKVVESWDSYDQSSLMRQRYEQELRVARGIQQALLPKEVGGDFYDFLELPDGRLGLVVGDATGKGVPAALVMAGARSMLRALAQTSNSPGDVLRKANDALVEECGARPRWVVRRLKRRWTGSDQLASGGLNRDPKPPRVSERRDGCDSVRAWEDVNRRHVARPEESM